MADVIIRLVVDPHTGKKNVVIGYLSDSDALPLEHEEQHRRLVDALIQGGALAAAELGEIVIEREPGAGLPAEAGTAEARALREAESAATPRGLDQDQ